MSSSIATDASISNPYHRHAWRDKDGDIHATVALSDGNTSTMYFDSAAEARAVAAACAQAADAMDKLAAAGDEAAHG